MPAQALFCHAPTQIQTYWSKHSSLYFYRASLYHLWISRGAGGRLEASNPFEIWVSGLICFGTCKCKSWRSRCGGGSHWLRAANYLLAMSSTSDFSPLHRPWLNSLCLSWLHHLWIIKRTPRIGAFPGPCNLFIRAGNVVKLVIGAQIEMNRNSVFVPLADGRGECQPVFPVVSGQVRASQAAPRSPQVAPPRGRQPDIQNKKRNVKKYGNETLKPKKSK